MNAMVYFWTIFIRNEMIKNLKHLTQDYQVMCKNVFGNGKKIFKINFHCHPVLNIKFSYQQKRVNYVELNIKH